MLTSQQIAYLDVIYNTIDNVADACVYLVDNLDTDIQTISEPLHKEQALQTLQAVDKLCDALQDALYDQPQVKNEHGFLEVEEHISEIKRKYNL